MLISIKNNQLDINQYQDILYITDENEIYDQELVEEFKNLVYFKCEYYDQKELKGAALEDCSHIILMATFNPQSQIQDSQTLTILNILYKFYPEIQYTIEIIDENNL